MWLTGNRIQIVGKCVIDSLHRELTIVVVGFGLFGDNGNRLACLGAFFLRLLCLARSRLGETPCCVLEKTMIMFKGEIIVRDLRI